MKKRIRDIALASMLLAAIVFGTYGVFARANPRLAAARPVTPVKGSPNTGAQAVPAVWHPGTGNAVPAMQASYSNLSDGNYTGSTEYAYYGYVKVDLVVHNGKITKVQVPTYPNDNGTSRYINSVALPYLVQEVVQAQNGQINLISGATFTSMAFVKSLSTALSKAAS